MHWSVVPLIYTFIGSFLYVPWLRTEPATSVHQDDALINWATQPGLFASFFTEEVSEYPTTFKIQVTEFHAYLERMAMLSGDSDSGKLWGRMGHILRAYNHLAGSAG